MRHITPLISLVGNLSENRLGYHFQPLVMRWVKGFFWQNNESMRIYVVDFDLEVIEKVLSHMLRQGLILDFSNVDDLIEGICWGAKYAEL